MAWALFDRLDHDRSDRLAPGLDIPTRVYDDPAAVQLEEAARVAVVVLVDDTFVARWRDEAAALAARIEAA